MTSTEYLGATICTKVHPMDKKDPGEDVCLAKTERLLEGWAFEQTRKIIIYDALVGSKLLYGLDTLPLTTASLNKLNAFHLKGLRRILRLPTAFVDRTMTNKKAVEIAEAEANKNTANRHAQYEPRAKRDHKQIKSVSEVLIDTSKKDVGGYFEGGPTRFKKTGDVQ